jgi:hypothetical protein
MDDFGNKNKVMIMMFNATVNNILDILSMNKMWLFLNFLIFNNSQYSSE